MTEKTAPIDGRTPEEKERQRRVRARLKRASEKVGMYEARLRGLHSDRSGTACLMYRGRAPLAEWWPVEKILRTIERDCLEGCPLSIEWMAETAKQRAVIDELREKRLPEADPNYDGPPMWTGAAKFLGRRKLSAIPRESKAKEHMEATLMRAEERLLQRLAARHGGL